MSDSGIKTSLNQNINSDIFDHRRLRTKNPRQTGMHQTSSTILNRQIKMK